MKLLTAACTALLALLLGVPRDPAPDFLLAGCVVETTSYSCQYRVSWVDDGHGPVDSVIVRDSVQGGASRRLAIGVPPFTNPGTFTRSWPLPATGQTLAGTVTARLERRGLLSPAASIGFSWSRPDVPPPTPAIDTTLEIAAYWIDPDTATIRQVLTLADGTPVRDATGQPVPDSLELCVFARFADGAIGTAQDVGTTRCAALAGVYTTGLSPGQQAVADTMCGSWRGVQQVAGLGRLRVPTTSPRPCRAWVYGS